ncbi:hypothetical protein P0Y67_21875, partial [Photobacterium sp. SP02]|uniref:hypothetical protein n=1 Tax=Photobacterium sp. SP02 TaxID=3032280 RepID=UPI0031456F7B
MKNVIKVSVGFMLSFVLFVSFSLFSQEAKAAGPEKIKVPSKVELINQGVDSSKVDKLIKKMESGKKLDADKYLEKLGDGAVLATEENPHYRKDFADGSFVENTIEDITEKENAKNMQLRSITQIGGTQEYRTLKISTTKVWGTMSFKVKIYFPLSGYSKILQAYDWYYLGSVYAENYKGIYRASETATADAVAIYKLQIEVAGNTGVRYLVKTEFRIRDGRYWTV